MPTQIERIEGLAGHLLDAFLSLRERYAILDPMLFDKEVARRRGSGKQLRGFKTLRLSLFLTCVQDIAKLTCDTDKRTPSIHNIVSDLEDPDLLAELKDRFAIWVLPSVETQTDPEIVRALQRMELREQAERRAQFDELHRELISAKDRLDASLVIRAFCTIRDKITAHTEVHWVADKYQLFDLGSLAVKWKDLKEPIIEMQRAVELIGLVVRNASFAWEMLDEQLSSAAHAFWNTPDAIG